MGGAGLQQGRDVTCPPTNPPPPPPRAAWQPICSALAWRRHCGPGWGLKPGHGLSLWVCRSPGLGGSLGAGGGGALQLFECPRPVQGDKAQHLGSPSAALGPAAQPGDQRDLSQCPPARSTSCWGSDFMCLLHPPPPPPHPAGAPWPSGWGARSFSDRWGRRSSPSEAPSSGGQPSRPAACPGPWPCGEAALGASAGQDRGQGLIS